jgi:hypothetical protein
MLGEASDIHADIKVATYGPYRHASYPSRRSLASLDCLFGRLELLRRQLSEFAAVPDIPLDVVLSWAIERSYC